MVTTRSKRKAEPEFIDLSSTEEDDVQNDVDNTVDSQKSKEDIPKTKSKETPEKANVSKAANKAVAFIGNAQSIDVYIPKSNFNIHIIDDDQILPAKNVLLKHPLKQQNTEISLSFQENYLVVNEVQGGLFVSASPNKERLMLSSNNIHPASEGSDEFFSAVEDKFEEDDQEQLADSLDPIKKDDADEEFIGADKHEEDDGFMNDNDQNTDDEPSSEATDEQMSDSDNSLAESQTEPMDNQGDYISSQGVIGVPFNQEAELAAKQQKEQEEKDRKRKEELEILQEKLAKQREEMKAKKLKIENERMAKKLEKQAKAEKLAEEARAKKEAKAEAKMLAEEAKAKAKKLAEEAKAKKLAEQTEAKRLAEEAKAKRLAEEAQAKKLAEEAEAKKLSEEAQAKKLAEEAEAKKLAEEAEAKKLSEEAQAKKLAEEAQAKKLAEEAKKLKEEKLKKAAEEKEASDKPVEDDNESLLGFDDDSDHEHFTQGNHSGSNHSVPNIDDEIPEEPESVQLLDFNDDQDNYKDNQQSNSDSLQFSGQESASVAEDPKLKSSGEPEKDEASLGLSDSVKSSASEKQESESASPKRATVEEDDDDDFEILDDPKKKISDAMKNDMFAYVSSSDDEEEAEEEEEQSKPAPVSTSLPKKRSADDFSDDEFDEFGEIGDKKKKTDKTANELDLFFDDDIFDIPKSKPAEKKPTTPQDAKKALAALMPDLGNIKVTKRRPTLLPSVTKTASTVTSEKSGTPSKENNSGMAQSDSNVSTTNTQKAASPVDADEKVKVTFVSQLTGFAKCIVIVSLKKKKTLRSISDKIIKTIMKQRPGSAYTYTSDDCSFYHKGVKLNKFNTIADIKMGPNENAVEITLVSADVEKELFKTGYEKMKSRELEESRMKQIDARMNLVDRSFSQIDKEIKDMDSVAAVKYTEEIGEVEAPAEAEEEPVDDGKFSIKLLDSHNKPKVVRVSGDMQISDVLKIFKESFSVNNSAKVTIMFDGDVVDLSETLEDLGMEEDDMLEFVVK